MKSIFLLSKFTSTLFLLFHRADCGEGNAVPTAVKLNYAAWSKLSINQHNKTFLEACSRKMSIAVLNYFNDKVLCNTTDIDEVEILCQEMRKSSFCHWLMDYHEHILIQSTITSYDSEYSSASGNKIINVDFSIMFHESVSPSYNMESFTPNVVQDILISLATDGIPNLFSLDPEVDSSWMILPSSKNCDIKDGNTLNTLSQVVLSRSAREVTQKKRLYSSDQIQVWEYSTPRSEQEGTKVISIFINQVLRFTTATMSSTIHAEALVHPTMVSHPEPSRVLLISDFPYAILNELHKYDPSLVERIDVAYTSSEVRDKICQLLPPNYNVRTKIPVTFHNNLEHLPDIQNVDDEPLSQFWDIRLHESNDYTDPQRNIYQKTRSICNDKQTALINKRNGYDWERHLVCGKDTIEDEEVNDDDMTSDTDDDDQIEYDVILMDVPSYFAAEWLSTSLQKKLKSLLDDEDGILAISLGSPPDINDFFSTSSISQHASGTSKPEYHMSARDSFLRAASRHPKNQGIGYKHVAIYDEVRFP